ncbi:hypothetical protein F5141DRAFT_1064280 [Pisolithus sp. B1]|nr:hypothetical protein F5141DRAFT_1064280 [Pisolithus sp. B1]
MAAVLWMMIPLSRSTNSVLAERMLCNDAVERARHSGGVLSYNLAKLRFGRSRVGISEDEGLAVTGGDGRTSLVEKRYPAKVSKGGLSMEGSSGVWRGLDLFNARRLVSEDPVCELERRLVQRSSARELHPRRVPSKQDKSPWFISVALASRKVDYRDLGTKPKNTNVVPSAIAGFGVTRDRNVFPMSPKGYERDQCIDAEPDGAEYDEVISEFVAGSYMKMEFTATFSTSLGLPLEPQNLSTHQLEKACAGFHVTGVVPVSRISHYLTIWSHPLVVSTNRIVSNSTNCPRKRFQA